MIFFIAFAIRLLYCHNVWIPTIKYTRNI